MPTDIKLEQLHETCYAGASWEMSMQYPFMMVIKRSEPDGLLRLRMILSPITTQHIYRSDNCAFSVSGSEVA